MEIQQKEKESLAAYIHQFKREAGRCKFNNNAAMIRIFIKGLRNAHTLATRVYEKGPQSLADAIREVEKLQAAQQLTATLVPSSSVNIMSSDEDKCFQCQESGYMAHHCPCIKCFDCDEYGYVAADCPDEIPLSGTQDAMIDLHLAMITGTDIGLTGQVPIPAVIDTVVTVKSNSQRSNSSSYHRCTHRSTLCHRHSSTYHHQRDTPHRRSSSHRSFSTHSRDCSRSRPHTSHKNTDMTSSKLPYNPDRTAWKNKNRRCKQVTIDDPPSKYYSSDEPASESDEDLN